MAEFRMPILGADMTAGTLVAWRAQAGQRVARGDIIAEVETDKGLIDVEVYVTGVIERLLVEPGARVPTGAVLALIREEAPAPGTAPTAGPAPTTAIPVALAPPPPVPAGARRRVSPLARRVAAEQGVDLTAVRGTGPGGVVTREDVVRATAAPAAAAVRPAVDVARMRQPIGAAMARSKREIPHYYIAETVDMQASLAWLAEENARRPVTGRLLYGVLLIKAVALALRETPELNARWHGDRAVPCESVHVGVAVSLRGGGLVAPALHDADRRPLDELMQGLRDVVQRARTGRLRSSELSDPTITVTSLGEQGVETVFGIVYPPQVAIVGFGRITVRPWVVEGAVVPRPLLTASLSADHRVSDGHGGGRFLAAVARRLQAPERL